MKFSQFTDNLKNNRLQFLKSLLFKGQIQIDGILYHEMYKGRLIVFVLLLLGNWGIEYKSGNKVDHIYLYHLPIIFLELFFEILMIILMPIIYSIMLIFIKTNKNHKYKKSGTDILYLRTDFLSNLREGGSFTHVNGFITGANKLKHSTILFAPGDFLNNARKFIISPYILWNNFYIEIAEMAYFLRLYLKILSKKINPKFIYQRHSGFDITGALLKIALKKPLVLEVNGLEYWVRKNWGTLHFGWLLKRAEKIIFDLADLIIVVSEVSKEDMIKFGVSPEKIMVNPNGVDEDEFKPNLHYQDIKNLLQIKSNEILIGFIGSFGPWHGIEILASAIPKILEKNSKIKFVLIGEGALKKRIETNLQKFTNNNQVIFTGLVKHSEVPKYLACCDILLSPHIPNKDGTRFFGSPTKLFEYMASGKAIVASNLEQIGKVLENNKTALLVPAGDINAITKSVNLLINDSRLRRNLGKNARIEAIKKYSWKINAQNVIQKIGLNNDK